MSNDRFPNTLTAAQMREADRRCIEELGIPGAVLMNNAGTAIYRALPPGSVGVVCGKGNNGGDGYVVARLALLDGRDTVVLLLADPDTIVGDAQIFLQAYLRLGGKLITATTDDAVTSALSSLAGYDLMVDAILGTGITGEVRGPARASIEAWPEAPATVAVDLPSGMNADTGEVCGVCIRAHKTVTLQYAKAGFNAPAAAPYLGELFVADIGIPAVCADDAAWKALHDSK